LFAKFEETYQVQTIRFDNFLDALVTHNTGKQLPPISVFKVDTQGYDTAVVLSAGKYLSSRRAPFKIEKVLIEVTSQNFLLLQQILDYHGHERSESAFIQSPNLDAAQALFNGAGFRLEKERCWINNAFKFADGNPMTELNCLFGNR
jgi:hypothetical protein